MKATIELGDAWLEEAKRVAAAEGTTLRELVEQGLRLAVARRSQRSEFRLRDAAFGEQGQWGSTEVPSAWLVLAYEGRGG